MRRATAAAALLLLAACSGAEPGTPGPVAVRVEVNAPALDAPAPVTHGDDALPPRPAALAGQAAPEHPWPCEGTGQDGRRVQLLYVHDGSGNLAANRAGFEAIARRIEGTFLSSAIAGGGERLLRFATDGACRLEVFDAVVSPGALGSFDAMINELAAAGMNRRDRIYHAWVDASTYCGIGTVYPDDRPAGNDNDAYAQYSRSDRPCWNYAEAHEITHNLGGVQDSAPNSTGGLHSRDEHDVMSYPDGGPRGQMIQPFPCPDASFEDRLDCGGNDYYSAAPSPAGYLATHWNVASASALSRGAGPTPPPASTTSTSTTTSSTTTTTVGRGRTRTDLSLPSRIRSGVPFAVTVTVTGACGPAGVVALRVGGMDGQASRQVLDSRGTSSVTMAITTSVGRPTVVADYEGSAACAVSRDTARPRVVG